MAVESVVECAWNGWTNQRGITGRMTVERVVEWAWNTQPVDALPSDELRGWLASEPKNSPRLAGRVPAHRWP